MLVNTDPKTGVAWELHGDAHIVISLEHGRPTVLMTAFCDGWALVAIKNKVIGRAF